MPAELAVIVGTGLQALRETLGLGGARILSEDGTLLGTVGTVEGVSPRAGTQGQIHPWVPDISLTRNSGMTANTSERRLL